jgi:hypothetical protein
VGTSSVNTRSKSAFAYADFFAFGPQQAFTASQHAAPSVQHFCTAAQQLLLSAQHFLAASQQPNLASATQHADCPSQQANFLAQQSEALSATVFAKATLLSAELPAVAFASALMPQQAADLSQQARPSAQHFCGVEQQAAFSAQHFCPFSQQPSFASAAQQALAGLQHANFDAQQSLACSPLKASPERANRSANNEPKMSFVTMNIFSS